MMGLRKPLKAASLHRRNDDVRRVLKPSDADLENAQKAVGVLIAPEQDSKGRNLHRSNLTAATISDLANGTDVAENSGLEVDRYVDDGLDADEEEGLDTMTDLVDDLELDSIGAPATLLEAADDEDDLDQDEVLEEEEEEEDLDLDDLPVEIDEFADDVGGDDAGTEDLTAETEIGEDEMTILDVDGVDEAVDEDELLVAPIEARLCVIRANRIIASASPADVQVDEEELYSEEFASVLASECSRLGLRKGLTSLGFRLERVKVGASHVVQNRVEAKAQKSVAAQLAKVKAREDSFGQCMALAAVGINKGFFPDAKHNLKAAMESQLLHLGVRNPRAVVAKLFAEHGIEFSKTLVTVAQRLAEMPDAGREAIAAALDFTADDVGTDEEVDIDVEADAVDYEDDAADFVDASTIEASLARPGRSIRVNASTSVTASAALRSSEVLQFV